MTQTMVHADPTAATATTTSGKSLRERAKALAPRIAERAQAVEEMRHVHEDSIAEMVEAGLTRGLQPRRYGGEEATVEDFVGAVIEISKACTSTGWVLCILGAHNWEMAHMSPELQDELYGDDPTTLLSSSYSTQGNKAQRVDGGFRLSGKWRSSSGVHHAHSVVLGADVPGEATHNFVVPLKDATVIDDWYTMGLAGTGSRSVVLDNVFVPEHRTLDREILQAQAGPGLRQNTATTFRVPQALLYSSVAGAPALGAGWRFYEEFPNYLGMPADRAGQFILDNALVLSKYTEARGLLNAQEILTLHWHREAHEYASRGEEMPVLRIAEAMYGIACGARAAVQVASSLMPAFRPSSVYSTSIVQRLYRDILVARQHGTQDADRAAGFMGKIQQGVPAGHAFLMQPDTLRAARERAAARGWV